MNALSVITGQTRLAKCASCGATIRAMLIVIYRRDYRPRRARIGELVRARAWVTIPNSHSCKSFFASLVDRQRADLCPPPIAGKES